MNVIGLWKNDGGGKSIILNGHVDVVPTGPLELWDESPWSGSIKDKRIYGRGSCDMKAGLTSAIFAVQILQSIGFEPKGNVMIQSVVGEESGGCGTLTNISKRILRRCGCHLGAHIVKDLPHSIWCPYFSVNDSR